MKSLTLIRLFVLSLVLVVTAGLASANLITNPGFETGNFTGWTTEGPVAVDNLNPHSGTFAADFNPNGLISQNVATIVGLTYDVSFWIASNSQGGAPAQMTLNGAVVSLPNGSGLPGYQLETFSFVATSNSTPIGFGLFQPGGFLDDISITVHGGSSVPETGSSALLFGLSLVGIVFVPRALPKLFRSRIA